MARCAGGFDLEVLAAYAGARQLKFWQVAYTIAHGIQDH
jgi:hypothetical protein